MGARLRHAVQLPHPDAGVACECDDAWKLKTGSLGKGLQTYLPRNVWDELQRTFVDTDPDKNWEALFAMVGLFGRIAQEVAEFLGHTYPESLVAGVTAHAHRMRDGVFAQGPLTDGISGSPN